MAPPKKEDPKKGDSKKDDPKKEDPKKDDPKKPDPKKSDPKKEGSSNEQSRKEEEKVTCADTIDTHRLGNFSKFALPTAAGLIATAMAHPFDVWKFNRQINIIESGPKISVLERLFKDRGLRGFMPGLSANLISQGLYQVFRIGTNGVVNKGDLDSIHREPHEINDEARIQLLANMTGALMSTPAEIALVSIATDRQQPPRFRKYYSGGYNSMLRTFKNGGLLASFRGGVATMARTGLASLCNFVIYNKVKKFLTDKGWLESKAGTIVSGLVLASIVTSIVTLPVDVIKTRYQTMRTCGGRPEFCGICPLSISIAKSGLKNFFRGFIPYTIRIGLFNFAFVGIFKTLHGLRDFIVDEPDETKKDEPPPPSTEESSPDEKGKKGKKQKRRYRIY